MSFTKIFLLSAFTTVLVGCDSSALRVVDATDGPDTGLDVNTNATDGPGFGPDINTNEVLINQLGFLKLQPDTSTPNFATALFGNLPNTITAGQVQAVFDLTTDTCRVTPVEAINFEAPKLDIFGLQPDLTSAGETVMLSSNAGTFATLNSSDGPTGPLYNTDVALNVATPSGLTADITGAEFPSFMNVRIEDVPALQVTSPAAGQNVDAFSFFQWRANIEPLSVVEIYSTGIDANGQEVLVACTAVDDGSFAFPESVRTQLGNNFDDFETTYLRIVYNTALSGDALLVTGNSISVRQ